MEQADQPVWLKIMQNGSVGEARTKAFLLDRFWVLERSVDIDGADFLIQPRSLGTRFTDRNPPRIGVVQAKYFQDSRTVHHIPEAYVVDERGNPLQGFFALLHVGSADDARIYLLSADQMKHSLDKDAENPPRYVVGPKALVDEFRVDQHRRQALDRIEHAITSRTAAQSLHFYDRVNIPLYRISINDIDYRYTLPIPNGQADIPKTYLQYREKLKGLTYEIEDGLSIIDRIMTQPDPRLAIKERANLEQYRAGRGLSDGLSFSSYKLDLDWPYLEEALDEHDARVAALERAGKLQSFVDLSHCVRSGAVERAAAIDPDGADGRFLWMRLNYDPATLAFGRIRLTLVSAKPNTTSADLSASSQLIAYKGKIDIPRAAENLWNGLMTRILLKICPELDDEDEE